MISIKQKKRVTKKRQILGLKTEGLDVGLIRENENCFTNKKYVL